MTTVSAPALDPLDLGVKLSNGGVDVVVYAPRASRVDVCFFDGDRETSWTLLPSPNGTWNGQVRASARAQVWVQGVGRVAAERRPAAQPS